jgi:hypothetical protein
MEPFHEFIPEYRKQMEKGAVKKAYRGLMEFMMNLRTRFAAEYPNDCVSGSLYFGFMDMTYFSLIPQFFKRRKLKIAIVFLHETCRFEVWLAGSNKQVQARYWKLIKESGWKKYRLVPALEGMDSILESLLVEKPDFRDLTSLTQEIEKAAWKFTKDVESFLARQDP